MASNSASENFERAQDKSWDLIALAMAGGIPIAGALAAGSFLKSNRSTVKHDLSNREPAGERGGGSDTKSRTEQHQRYRQNFWDGKGTQRYLNHAKKGTPPSRLQNALYSALNYHRKLVENKLPFDTFLFPSADLNIPVNFLKPGSYQAIGDVFTRTLSVRGKGVATEALYRIGDKDYTAFLPHFGKGKKDLASSNLPGLRSLPKGIRGKVGTFMKDLSGQSRIGSLFGQAAIIPGMLRHAGAKEESLSDITRELFERLSRTPDEYFEQTKTSRSKIFHSISALSQKAARLSTTKIGLGVGPRQTVVDLARGSFFGDKGLYSFALNRGFYGTPQEVAANMHQLSPYARGYKLNIGNVNDSSNFIRVISSGGGVRGELDLSGNIAGLAEVGSQQAQLAKLGYHIGIMNPAQTAEGLLSRISSTSAIFGFATAAGGRVDEPLQHQVLGRSATSRKAARSLSKNNVFLRAGSPIYNLQGLADLAFKGQEFTRALPGLFRDVTTTETDNVMMATIISGRTGGDAKAVAGRRFAHEFKEGAMGIGFSDTPDINRKLALATEVIRPTRLQVPMDFLEHGKTTSAFNLLIDNLLSAGTLDKNNSLAVGERIYQTYKERVGNRHPLSGMNKRAVLEKFFKGELNKLNLQVKIDANTPILYKTVGGITEPVSHNRAFILTGVDQGASQFKSGVANPALLGFEVENLIDNPSAAAGIHTTHTSPSGFIPTSFRSAFHEGGIGLTPAVLQHAGNLKSGTAFLSDVITFLEAPNITRTALRKHHLSEGRANSAAKYMAEQLHSVFKGMGLVDTVFNKKDVMRRGGSGEYLYSLLQEDISEDKIMKAMKDYGGGGEAMNELRTRLAQKQRQIIGSDEFGKILGLGPQDLNLIREHRKILEMYSPAEMLADPSRVATVDTPGGGSVYAWLRALPVGTKAEQVEEVVANMFKAVHPGQYGSGMKYNIQTAAAFLDFYGKSGVRLAQMHMGIMQPAIKAGWVGASIQSLFVSGEPGESLLDAIKTRFKGLKVGDHNELRDIIGADAGVFSTFARKHPGLIAAGTDSVDVPGVVRRLMDSEKGFVLDLKKINPDISLTFAGHSDKSISEVLIEPIGRLQTTGIDPRNKEFIGKYNQAAMAFMSQYDYLRSGGSTGDVKVQQKELQSLFDTMMEAKAPLYLEKGGALNQLFGGVRYGMSSYTNVQSNTPIITGLKESAANGLLDGKSGKNKLPLYRMHKGKKIFLDERLISFDSWNSVRGSSDSAMKTLKRGGFLDDVFADIKVNGVFKQINVGKTGMEFMTREPATDRSAFSFMTSVVFNSESQKYSEQLGLKGTMLFKGSGGTTYIDPYANIRYRGDYDKDKWIKYAYEQMTESGELDVQKTREFQHLARKLSRSHYALRDATMSILEKQGLLETAMDFTQNAKFNLHDFNNLSILERITVLQQKVNQKNLTPIVNLTLAAKKNAIKNLIQNPRNVEDMMAAIKGITKEETKALLDMAKRTDISTMSKLLYEGYSAAVEQTPINKGYASLAILRAMASGGEGATPELKTNIIELGLFGNQLSETRRSELVKSVAEGVKSLTIADLKAMEGINPVEISKLINDLNSVDLSNDVTSWAGKTQKGIANVGGVDPHGASGAAKLIQHMNDMAKIKVGTDIGIFDILTGAKYSKLDIHPEAALAGILEATQGKSDSSLDRVLKLAMQTLGLGDSSLTTTDLKKWMLHAQIAHNRALAKTPNKGTLSGAAGAVEGSGGDVFSKIWAAVRGSGDLIASQDEDFIAAKGRWGAATQAVEKHVLTHKFGYSVGGVLAGAVVAGGLLNLLSADSTKINEAPLPRNLPLDNPDQYTPHFDTHPQTSVRLAGEMPALNSMDFQYEGGNPSDFISNVSSSVTGLSGTIIMDDREHFNRQSMNQYKDRQDRSRF